MTVVGVTETEAVPIEKTAEEAAKTLAGQRKVNLIWEFTQATIAITVVFGYFGIVIYSAISGKDLKLPESLTNILFLVLTSYFVRTNHSAIGGVGPKPENKYTGR